MKTEKEDKNLKTTDTLKTEDIVELLYADIMKSLKKIKDFNNQIAQAIDMISKKMLKGGKLYVYGCSTPARLAIVENLEVQSLFSLNPELIKCNIFGGDNALKNILSEPQDSENNGRAEIVLSFVKSEDVLIILNSKDYPKYSKGALMVAEQKNIPTIQIGQEENLCEYADVNIILPVKNKKIGSLSDVYFSNLYKIILNMIFTGVMIKLGKVYEKNIIDPSVLKHKEQAVSVVMKYAKTDEETAISVLEKCKYHPKIAIVMLRENVEAKTAISMIKKKKGKIDDFIS